MVRLEQFFSQHEVSAGEAAAAGLYGRFSPVSNWTWETTLLAPDEREDWEVLVLEVYHCTAAGLDYHGKLMSLLAVPLPGATIHFLTAKNRCQYAGQRVALAYPQWTNNGFAVLAVTPVLIAGDILRVTGLLRRHRNG